MGGVRFTGPPRQVRAELRSLSAPAYERALMDADAAPVETLLGWADRLAGELGLPGVGRPPDSAASSTPWCGCRARPTRWRAAMPGSADGLAATVPGEVTLCRGGRVRPTVRAVGVPGTPGRRPRGTRRPAATTPRYPSEPCD